MIGEIWYIEIVKTHSQGGGRGSWRYYNVHNYTRTCSGTLICVCTCIIDPDPYDTIGVWAKAPLAMPLCDKIVHVCVCVCVCVCVRVRVCVRMHK